MLAAQGGKCGICLASESGRPGWSMAVDHDHATGRIRGVLCYQCNTALGRLDDSPERLLAAAQYLEGFGAQGAR